MSKWLERARVLEGDGAVSSLSADSIVSAPNCPNCANCTASISPAVIRGLAALDTMRRPMRLRAEDWDLIVADAHRLVCGEWASSALTLGWDVEDLWGVSADRDGLAVWLRGRRLTLLDSNSAIVDDGEGRRAQYNRARGGMQGAKLLWGAGR